MTNQSMMHIVALTVLLAVRCGPKLGSRCPVDESETYVDTGITSEPPKFSSPDEELYHAVVSNVLGGEAAELGGCYRMISIVETKPEELLWIDCTGLRSGEPSKIVHRVATESIRHKLQSAGLIEASHVHTRRTEVVLPLEASVLLAEVWQRMVELAESNPGFITKTAERRDDHFVMACNAGCLGAVVDHPPKGSPGAEFVALGQLLAELADSGSDRRSDLQVRTRATVERVARSIRGQKPRVRRLFRWEGVVRGLYRGPENNPPTVP